MWFLAKTLVFLFIYVWLRAALPRLRYDQLMDLGWKRLIPLSLGWLMVVAGFVIGGWWGAGPRRGRRGPARGVLIRAFAHRPGQRSSAGGSRPSAAGRAGRAGRRPSLEASDRRGGD